MSSPRGLKWLSVTLHGPMKMSSRASSGLAYSTVFSPAAGEPLLPAESDSPDHVDAYAERNFTWTCATPHTEVEFRAVLRKQDGTEIERLATVTPSADGTLDVLLRFP